MFISRIKPSNVDPIPNVNKIGAEVYYLVHQLPPRKAFNIFMDNYFSSINLFNFFEVKAMERVTQFELILQNFPLF